MMMTTMMTRLIMSSFQTIDTFFENDDNYDNDNDEDDVVVPDTHGIQYTTIAGGPQHYDVMTMAMSMTMTMTVSHDHDHES